jgi:hypothetical protein
MHNIFDVAQHMTPTFSVVAAEAEVLVMGLELVKFRNTSI